MAENRTENFGFDDIGAMDLSSSRPEGERSQQDAAAVLTGPAGIAPVAPIASISVDRSVVVTAAGGPPAHAVSVPVSVAVSGPHTAESSAVSSCASAAARPVVSVAASVSPLSSAAQLSMAGEIYVNRRAERVGAATVILADRSSRPPRQNDAEAASESVGAVCDRGQGVIALNKVGPQADERVAVTTPPARSSEEPEADLPASTSLPAKMRNKRRKNIKEIISEDELNAQTKAAKAAERHRLLRIAEHLNVIKVIFPNQTLYQPIRLR